MSRFTRRLIVCPLTAYRWEILGRFSYDVGFENSGEKIVVPIGYITDFASVPRALWWLLPQWGRYGNAAVIHDWLYTCKWYPRRRADEIFLEGMKVLKVVAWQRCLMYGMVRLFGWYAWKRARSWGAATPPALEAGQLAGSSPAFATSKTPGRGAAG